MWFPHFPFFTLINHSQTNVEVHAALESRWIYNDGWWLASDLLALHLLRCIYIQTLPSLLLLTISPHPPSIPFHSISFHAIPCHTMTWYDIPCQDAILYIPDISILCLTSQYIVKQVLTNLFTISPQFPRQIAHICCTIGEEVDPPPNICTVS